MIGDSWAAASHREVGVFSRLETGVALILKGLGHFLISDSRLEAERANLPGGMGRRGGIGRVGSLRSSIRPAENVFGDDI